MKHRQLEHIGGTQIKLQKNISFSFALNHAMEIYRFNTIYSYIPKNACSTMRYSIIKENGLIDNEKDYYWLNNNGLACKPNIKSLITADYTFVILRCPFKRLASLFLDKFVGQTRVAKKYAINTKNKVKIKDLTFSTFVNSLTDINILNSDHHWRPQVDFLIYKQYDDYFSIENFSDVEKTLNEKKGFTVVDARKITNHGTDRLTLVKKTDDSSNMPINELIKMKSENKMISHNNLYNKKLYAMIGNLYLKDIELYRSELDHKNIMKL